MTPRENFIRFLRNEAYEWVPNSMDQLNFAPLMIPDHKARGLVVQQVPYNGPYGGKDMFGVEWMFQPEAGGSMEVGTLMEDIEDWENVVVFPDLDAFDWEGCARENADYLKTDKIVSTTIYTTFFERLISFVGFENAAMALVDEDQLEAVERLFDALADFYIDYIRRLHRWFNVELVVMHDDWGTQTSTMFSGEIHKELFVPRIRRIANAAHAEGVFIEQHSCGKIESIFPNIVDSGVDTWAGQSINDKKMLVERFGDRFAVGMCIILDRPMNDDEMCAEIKAVMDDYSGKRIWLAIFGHALTHESRQMLSGYIRGRGR